MAEFDDEGRLRMFYVREQLILSTPRIINPINFIVIVYLIIGGIILGQEISYSVKICL